MSEDTLQPPRLRSIASRLPILPSQPHPPSAGRSSLISATSQAPPQTTHPLISIATRALQLPRMWVIRLAHRDLQVRTHPSQAFCFRQGWMQIKGPGLVEMKGRKFGRQTDPPSQMGSGTALAPIPSQYYVLFVGACAGFIHIVWLDLTYWRFAHLQMRTKELRDELTQGHPKEDKLDAVPSGLYLSQRNFLCFPMHPQRSCLNMNLGLSDSHLTCTAGAGSQGSGPGTTGHHQAMLERSTSRPHGLGQAGGSSVLCLFHSVSLSFSLPSFSFFPFSPSPSPSPTCTVAVVTTPCQK